MERGDKQESRRQFHLNYAEANFILTAETHPPSTCRPDHKHVNTNSDLEFEYLLLHGHWAIKAGE